MQETSKEENMSKSKVRMPQSLHKKCQNAINIAAAEAAAAGTLPIPMSDTIPITAAQIAMVIKLGKIFDLTISETAAKTILGLGLTQQAGRAIVANILKCIPGAGSVIGGVIGGATAAALTEALGWIVADDFYQIYEGADPDDVFEAANTLKDMFKDTKIHKSKIQK